MKALAASSIGQYEKSVQALAGYYRTVGLGLGACFRESGPAAITVALKGQDEAGAIGAIVFGSDQGLVGQFNDVVADYAIKTLSALPGKPEVWAVGERVHLTKAHAVTLEHDERPRRGIQRARLQQISDAVVLVTAVTGDERVTAIQALLRELAGYDGAAAHAVACLRCGSTPSG